MREYIIKTIRETIALKEKIIELILDEVVHAAELIISSLKNGGKLLIFGNGGSAADSQHLAAELVGRFLAERKGLSAIALTTNSSVLTSVSNDYSFDDLFARQIEALGKNGDVALGITTSGKSKNVLKAFETASKIGLYTIALTGIGGADLSNIDVVIAVPSQSTPRIQEAHIIISHIICGLIEEALLSNIDV